MMYGKHLTDASRYRNIWDRYCNGVDAIVFVFINFCILNNSDGQ